MGKVIKKEELESLLTAIKGENVALPGKTIVLTNGCFDILHIGHARYLREAKRLGDYLFIGINSDESVKLLKGPGRPLNNENDRAELLSYFSFVDYLVIFEEKTADNLIMLIKPDVYVKGGDYTKESLPEGESIDKVGAKAAFISFVAGYSTTKIINRINEI
jgi:rfaE bifunctional protein nucleotidyltransferase chain/domain